MNVRAFAIAAVVTIASSTASAPALAPVNWASITSLAGTYSDNHPSQGRVWPYSTETHGTARLPNVEQYPYNFRSRNYMGYKLSGSAEETVRHSAPLGPNFIKRRTVHISIIIFPPQHVYNVTATPINYHGDSYGGVFVSNIPLPTVGNELCARDEIVTSDEGTYHEKWLFYPTNVRRQASPCISTHGPGAGPG